MTRTIFRARRARRGSVALCAVLLLFIVSSLGMAVLTLATNSLRLANRRMYDQKALNLAMAGAAESQSGFKANVDFLALGQSNNYTVSGPHGGTIKLTCVSSGGYLQGASIGTVTGGTLGS